MCEKNPERFLFCRSFLDEAARNITKTPPAPAHLTSILQHDFITIIKEKKEDNACTRNTQLCFCFVCPLARNLLLGLAVAISSYDVTDRSSKLLLLLLWLWLIDFDSAGAINLFSHSIEIHNIFASRPLASIDTQKTKQTNLKSMISKKAYYFDFNLSSNRTNTLICPIIYIFLSNWTVSSSSIHLPARSFCRSVFLSFLACFRFFAH